MSQATPKDTYLIGGAGLPIRSAVPPFRYDQARGFQSAALRWITEGERPVGLLAAPTGSGKTAVIAALAETSDRILCLYPTNALTEAQAETLREDYDLEVDVLTGRTLTERGTKRAQEVMRYARDPAGGDVVITNPDVLQAILGKQYLSPGSELLGFFAYFDGAVYDEFHFYNPLAASGILLQIKVLAERGQYRGPEGEREFPRVLLSSATPAQSFVDHVQDDLELDVQRIRSTLVPLDVGDSGPDPETTLAYDSGEVQDGVLAEPGGVRAPIGADDLEAAYEAQRSAPETVDRFRYPMVVNRWDQPVEESFDIITEALQTGIRYEQGEEPKGRAAVIFNSAARSNRFHQYLLQETEMGAFALKDNGYDTGSDRKRNTEFAILNTTSKGEVGLDFNLDRLVMVTPFTASDFVQRIGRAARHSPAVVDIFGLKDPRWPPVQSYPAFLGRVADGFGDARMRRDRLRDLLGLRAARALKERIDDNRWHTADMFEDFGDVSNRQRWSEFLQACDGSLDVPDVSEDPFASRPDTATTRVITGVRAALGGLDSLRGRSIEQRIQYPFGDGTDQTDYDLVTALRHYQIEEVQGDVVRLGDGEPGSRLGFYPGKPAEGRGVNLSHSQTSINRDLRSGLESYLDNAGLTGTELEEADLRRFLQVVDLSSAMVPERIEAGGTVFYCSEDGDVERIEEDAEL